MAKPIHEQLSDAWRASGITLEQLIAIAKLKIRVPALSKKLAGLAPLKTKEAEAIANALRVRVSAGREARAS